MVRSLLSRVLLGAILLALVPSAPAAYAVTTVRNVSLPDLVAAPGELVYVPVRVAEAGGLQNFTFSLQFDPAQLTYIGFHATYDMPLKSSLGGEFPQPDGTMKDLIGGGSEQPLPAGPATVLLLRFRVAPDFAGIARLHLFDPGKDFLNATLRDGSITVGIPPALQLHPDDARAWLPSTARLAQSVAIASNTESVPMQLAFTDALEPWSGAVAPYTTSGFAIASPESGPVHAEILAPAAATESPWQKIAHYALRIRPGAALLEHFAINPDAPVATGKEWWAEKVLGGGYYGAVNLNATTGPADGSGFELKYTYKVSHERELQVPGGIALYPKGTTTQFDSKFVALSFGNRAILDRPGKDLAVHVAQESSAQYAVYGSVRDDCMTYRMAAEGLRGTQEVDLAGADVGWSRCVLVVNQTLHGAAIPATTVDGVRAISLGVILRNTAEGVVGDRTTTLETATAMDVTPFMREGTTVTLPPTDGAGTKVSLVGSPILEPEEHGELTLQTTEAYGMDRFGVTLAYDPTLVQFLGVTNASPVGWATSAKVLEPLDGLARIALTASSDLRMSTEGIAPLLRVRFAARSTPQGGTATVQLLDPAFDIANATLEAGTIEVLPRVTGEGTTVSLAERSAQRGMIVELPLTTTRAEGIERFAAVLSYDPAVLSFEGGESRLGFEMDFANGSTPDGWWDNTIIGERSDGPLSDDGPAELVVLRFRVLEDAPIGISPAELRAPGLDIEDAILESGAVTVLAPPPPPPPPPPPAVDDVCITLRKPDVEEGGTYRTQQKVLNLAGEVCAGVTTLSVNGEDVPLVAGNNTWHAQMRLDLGSTRVRIEARADDERTAEFGFTAKREEKNPEATDAKPFEDVPNEHFAAKAITELRAKGVVEGDGASFQPDRLVTRAEFAKMLAKTIGVKPASAGAFTDVPMSHTLRGYVAAVAARGWAMGDNGKFHPDRTITRLEAARMIQRAKKLKSGTCAFTDLEGEAREVACGLVQKKIASGNNGRFEPNRPLTRGEAAKMLAAL